MEKKNDLHSIAVNHAKQAVNTYKSRSKLKLINLGIPFTVPYQSYPANGRARDNERKSVVVCVSFNCHPLLDGQSLPRQGSRVATCKFGSHPGTHIRVLSLLRKQEGRASPLSLVSPAGDISEKEIPNKRAMESRLYNSWDHPAFVVDGSTQRAAIPLLSLSLSHSISFSPFLLSPSSLLAIVTPAASQC